MKKIFVLAGNFGVGKSSITTFHKHEPADKPFTKVHGVLSLGGERGADTLNSSGYDKERVFTEVIPKHKDDDILVHSVFFQGVQDLNRYEKTHKLVYIYLRTPYEVNKARIAARSEGAKKINDKAFVSFLKTQEKARQFCMYSKAKYHRVDNDRPLSQVAKDVWAIIDMERKVPSEMEGEVGLSP